MKLNPLATIVAASLAASSLGQSAELNFKPLSTLNLAGAEISAYDPGSERFFVTSIGGLQIIDASDPAAPSLVSTISFTGLGFSSDDVTSVASHGGTLAVALVAPVKTAPGTVVFLNAADGALLGSATVGSLPDNVVFTPDGSKVLTANEGELTGAVATDTALGTVSIIDVSGGFTSPPVTTVDFTSFDSQTAALRTAGVRIFAGATPSLDFEPEYIAVSADSTKAMVTLQEANAVALLDLGTNTFTAVVPLGEKDFSGLLADFSDRDGPSNSNLTKLTRGNPVFGLYMPDAIASYEASGNTYYITANEGDDRDDFFTETVRVGHSSYTLDPTVFPNAAELKTNAKLGRLTVSNSPGLRGDIDNDGDIDRILAYGGRSFSILDSSGNQVYDSGDLIERAMANLGSPWFDDGRSGKKAAEPEGVTTGVIGGRTYAFIGLERSRGVIAFDVTDPLAPTVSGFATVATDQNPEGVSFIPASDSPNGVAMLAVANETSNTLSLYSIEPVDFTLQLLHLADAEAGLLASETAPNLAALVDAFDGTFPNTLILAGGDNFIPGPFLSAGTDPSLNAVLSAEFGGSQSTAFARPDIAIHNILGVEASAIGNHEFDLGSPVFKDAITPSGSWVGATFPHISANISFTGDTLSSNFTAVSHDGAATPLPDAATHAGKIVPTATIVKGGEKIGLVGVTTQILESISSPSGARILGFAQPKTGVDDMDLLATQLQPYIDELAAEGVNKIILLSHLQLIANEQSLATKLSGVDIILSAGSNTRLGDADDTAVAFPGHTADFANNYPIRTTGLDSKPVLIVNTDNEFTYLGRLVVDFDESGEVILPNIAANSLISGAFASNAATVASAWGVAEIDLSTTAFAGGTKGARVKAITDAVQGIISAKDGMVYGITDHYLEGERAFVRSEETNLGSITAEANAEALRAISGTNQPIVSIKNGGGIRAQIGTLVTDPVTGIATKVRPAANPAAGKPEGGISQLDIENSLRFNNRLMACETTPAGLKQLLEHGVKSYGQNGRFPQIGGVAFSFDPTAAEGSRVRAISLIDANGDSMAAICLNGEIVAGAPAAIQIVTLSFLAEGGDSYPFRANCDNFRYILDDNSLTAAIPETENFSTVQPSNGLGEQEAFSDYITARFPDQARAYATADTTAANDLRIQRTNARTDLVLPYTGEQIARLNAFSQPLLGLGLAPASVLNNAPLIAALDVTKQAGQDTVTSNPAAFGLYTPSSIQDLRGSGNLLVRASEGEVTITMPVEKSGTLLPESFSPAGDLELTIPQVPDKEFYRVAFPD
jgi:2',3'-cyclic-nucleotide 2'-phosphodiesterase (5'-nucleotidase family)/DNA-binding beta-propeller fold protein YncE